MEKSTYYDTLEVKESASEEEIKKSYRRLAKEYHPDGIPSHKTKLIKDAEEKVKEINEAYGVLGDAYKRKQYDKLLGEHRKKSTISQGPTGGNWTPPPPPPPKPTEQPTSWVKSQWKRTSLPGRIFIVGVLLFFIIPFIGGLFKPKDEIVKPTKTAILVPAQKSMSKLTNSTTFESTKTHKSVSKKNKTDVNAKDKFAWTALMHAASNGHADIVRELINSGADVNANSYGLTALMEAAGNGHADIVRELINSGADVNAKTIYGWTALMLAAQNGHTDVVKILKDAGAK